MLNVANERANRPESGLSDAMLARALLGVQGS